MNLSIIRRGGPKVAALLLVAGISMAGCGTTRTDRCAVYETTLAGIRTALATAPADPHLIARLAVMQAMADAACTGHRPSVGSIDQGESS